MAETVPAAPETLSDFTLQTMLPLWTESLYKNLPKIRSGLNLQDLKPRKEPAIIVGAGPSLKYFDHLKMIKESGWKHTVLSCDKVLRDCLINKIVPYATASVDGTTKIAGFYSSAIVRRFAKEINGIFSITTHPKVISTWEKANGKLYWYTPMLDSPNTPDGKLNPRSLSFFLWNLTKQKVMMSGMGNVGAFLWNVASALEADPIILVGFDFSEQVHDKSDAIYFQPYTSMYLQKYKPDEAQDKAALLHQLEENPDFIAEADGEGWLKEYYTKGMPVRYLINPTWKLYRKVLARHIKTTNRLTINATGNGCLHSQAKDEKGELILDTPNFQCMNLKEVLEKYA